MFRILFYFCDHKCSSPVSKNTNAGPKTLDDIIDCRQIKKISITKLVKISQNLFSLVITTLSFGKSVSGMAVGTKFMHLHEIGTTL